MLPAGVPTLVPGRPLRRLPRSFFGVSAEFTELPQFDQFMPAFEQILNSWKIAGDGPQVLRIGGDSADLTYWDPRDITLPGNAFVLSRPWFQQTAQLIAQAGLQVIVDLNLQNGSPALAQTFAREAEGTFPAGSIIGWQIGNEPDRYGRGFGPAQYAAAVRAYARALGPVDGGAPLVGPAVTSVRGNIHFLRTAVALARRQIGVIDGHEYPLGACASPGSRTYPTIAKLISPALTTGLAQLVAPVVALARREGKPFRLDEMNSVMCGGTAGVSNSFASALWAPGALLTLLRAGVGGVNIHIRSSTVNAPLQLDATGLTARPLYYGMALFARMMSPDGTLLRLHPSESTGPYFNAWAAKVSTGATHVLLINKNARPVTVKLALPAGDVVTMQQLLAPSIRATRGVTLAGQQLGADGQMTGTFIAPQLHPGRGGFLVTVPAASAALVSAQPAG